MPVIFQEGSQYPAWNEQLLPQALEEGRFFCGVHAGSNTRILQAVRRFLQGHEMRVLVEVEPETIAHLPDLENYIDANFELKLGDSSMLQSINYNHHETMKVPIEQQMEADREEDRLGLLQKSRLEARPASLEQIILQSAKSTGSLLLELMERKKKEPWQLWKASNLDPALFLKLLKPGSKPDKAQLSALCIGLELDADETRALLKKAGYSFSRSLVSDLIVRYFLEKNMYDIDALNLMLFSHGQPQLGAEAKGNI